MSFFREKLPPEAAEHSSTVLLKKRDVFFSEKKPPEAAEHSSTVLLKKRDVSNKTHKFKFNENSTKWTHMARYGLIFGQNGAKYL